jgi:ATPase subunit of ABC transporter with duplicated ATPase domains
MLLGLEHPDEGTVRLGANVLPGYLAQEHENLNPQSTVLEEVSSVCSGSQSDVRTLLSNHRTISERVNCRVSLWGGETRLPRKLT